MVIAGGTWAGADEGFRSTEVLDLDSREITAGEPMTTPRYWFHLATIRQGGREKVLAVGGHDGSVDGHDISTYENTVEELVVEEEGATWRKADSILEERRSYYGAVVVPEQFICPT